MGAECPAVNDYFISDDDRYVRRQREHEGERCGCQHGAANRPARGRAVAGSGAVPLMLGCRPVLMGCRVRFPGDRRGRGGVVVRAADIPECPPGVVKEDQAGKQCGGEAGTPGGAHHPGNVLFAG